VGDRNGSSIKGVKGKRKKNGGCVWVTRQKKRHRERLHVDSRGFEGGSAPRETKTRRKFTELRVRTPGTGERKRSSKKNGCGRKNGELEVG